MKIIRLFSLLLTCALFLGSCQSELPEAGSSHIKPRETNNEQTDLFSSLRNTKETWISVGLKAYEEKIPPQDLTGIFSKPEDIALLTLYETVFETDPQRATAVAEDFFRFVADEYGVEEVCNKNKRVDYKNQYLKAKGSELKYTQPIEVEILLSSMILTKSAEAPFPYTISIGPCFYHFSNLQLSGSISPTHGFLYYNTLGLTNLVDHIEGSNWKRLLNPVKRFHFYMTFSKTPYSKTNYATGNMYINSIEAPLHEAVHVMGIQNDETIWLSEGICEYLGKGLGFQEQIDATYLQIVAQGQKGAFDEKAAEGNPEALRNQKAAEYYLSKGGKIDSLEHFDALLFIDSFAKAELETGHFSTIGDAYRSTNIVEECTLPGSELSYSQAGSLVSYLAKNYGVDQVLNAYRTQNITAAFGKDLNALKSEWQAAL